MRDGGDVRAPRPRLRRLLLALLLPSLLPLAPAVAAGVPVAREYVTLRGTGARSVLVRFDRRVDFLAGGNAAEFYHPHLTVSGSGIRGFAVLPARADAHALSVVGLHLPAAHGTRDLVWPIAGEGFSFPAGVYRLVLLGSGTGSVRLRLPGLRPGTVTFAPATPLGLRTAVAAPAARTTARYEALDTHELSRRTHALSYLWFNTPLTATTRTSGCYYSGGPPLVSLPECEDGTAVVDAQPRQDHASFSIGWTVLDPGTWTMQTEVAAAGTIDAAGAVFLWLDV